MGGNRVTAGLIDLSAVASTGCFAQPSCSVDLPFSCISLALVLRDMVAYDVAMQFADLKPQRSCSAESVRDLRSCNYGGLVPVVALRLESGVLLISRSVS
jgi:hypothetical protein